MVALSRLWVCMISEMNEAQSLDKDFQDDSGSGKKEGKKS